MVEVLLVARAEIDDAAQWYEERREGVGRRLAQAAREALERIERFPFVGARWLADETIEEVRRVPVTGFPYLVVYITSPRLVVIAFAHGSRQPGYWIDRLDEV